MNKEYPYIHEGPISIGTDVSNPKEYIYNKENGPFIGEEAALKGAFSKIKDKIKDEVMDEGKDIILPVNYGPEDASPFPGAGTFIGEGEVMDRTLSRVEDRIMDEARAEASREAKAKCKDIILPLNYANITKPGTTGMNCEKLNMYKESRVCKDCGMGLYEEAAKGSGMCDCCFIDSEIQGLTNEYLKYVYVASRDSNGDMNKYFGFRKWVASMTNSMATSSMEHGWGEK